MAISKDILFNNICSSVKLLLNSKKFIFDETIDLIIICNKIKQKNALLMLIKYEYPFIFFKKYIFVFSSNQHISNNSYNIIYFVENNQLLTSIVNDVIKNNIIPYMCLCDKQYISYMDTVINLIKRSNVVPTLSNGLIYNNSSDLLNVLQNICDGYIHKSIIGKFFNINILIGKVMLGYDAIVKNIMDSIEQIDLNFNILKYKIKIYLSSTMSKSYKII